MGLQAISLFSGAGGLDLAAKSCGIRTVCYVENDPYAQGVLMSRIRDKRLDDAPIWDDVRTFDGKPWLGKVDCVFGGFPCQDLTHVGKRRGIVQGTKSKLWFQFARIIEEVRPRYILIENVPGLLKRGFQIILAQLYEIGFDALWFCLGAGTVGAPHRRDRLWVVGFPKHSDANRFGLHRTPINEQGRPESWGVKFQDKQIGFSRPMVSEILQCGIEPSVFRMVDGMEFRSHRLRCTGNGVVPQQALPVFQKIVEWQ